MAWQDMNLVMMMTTAHTPKQAQEEHIDEWRSAAKRKDIPDSCRIKLIEDTENQDSDERILFSRIIVDYNKKMSGVDDNAQMCSYYHPDIYSHKYWWPLWLFILCAAVVNSYILYMTKHPESKMTHKQWQQEIALSLMGNQAGRLRTALKNDNNCSSAGPILKHQRTHLSKTLYCTPCGVNKRTSKSRKPLGSIDDNMRRRRPPRSIYGCSNHACEGKSACRNEACWLELHREHVVEHANLGCR